MFCFDMILLASRDWFRLLYVLFFHCSLFHCLKCIMGVSTKCIFLFTTLSHPFWIPQSCEDSRYVFSDDNSYFEVLLAKLRYWWSKGLYCIIYIRRRRNTLDNSRNVDAGRRQLVSNHSIFDDNYITFDPQLEEFFLVQPLLKSLSGYWMFFPAGGLQWLTDLSMLNRGIPITLTGDSHIFWLRVKFDCPGNVKNSPILCFSS